MTEKQYGGSSSFGFKDKNASPIKPKEVFKANSNNLKSESFFSSNINIEKLKLAGAITSKAKEFARSFIKKGMPLLEIAEKIESFIEKEKGKPAFPVNLSINEIAAHSTSSYNDISTAQGLLKVDIGVHIDGWIADSAFSIDLENSEENQKLIKTAELALQEAVKLVKYNLPLNKIGNIIEETIIKNGFHPIQNLSGHSILPYNLHAGMNIPNIKNSSPALLPEGVYAIEPFTTSGLGSVRDSRLSGIYSLQISGNVRDSFSRQVLAYIEEEYETLPFCSRWLVKKFGTRALLALKRLEEASLLHHYPQLIEISGKKVAQAEHTIIITNQEVIVTTL